MVLDTPATALPCSACAAPCAGDCQNGRPFPCSERVAAAAKLDEQIALDLIPGGFPPDAWALVVRAVVERQRGPVGLPVGGGVLHVLGERDGRAFKAAVAYCSQRQPQDDGSPPADKYTARAAMRALGYRDLAVLFDALEVYFARVQSPARAPGDDDDASGEGRIRAARRPNMGIPSGKSAPDRAFFRRQLGEHFNASPSVGYAYAFETSLRLAISAPHLVPGG